MLTAFSAIKINYREKMFQEELSQYCTQFFFFEKIVFWKKVSK